MKHTLLLALILLILTPTTVFAEEPIIEPIKADKDAKVGEAAKKAPAAGDVIEESEIGAKEGAGAKNVEAVDVEVKIEKKVKIAPAYQPRPRERTFRAGIVGPGIYAGNKSIDAMMGIGAEGEYFIFEKLSAGLRIQVATDFSSDAGPNSILSFLPQARYIFDFENHPRWSVYVQAGAGVGLLDGKHVGADIAIPGGGFWWQWNERFSVGADASLHILVRSEDTAVAFFAGPAFRYQF